jgi:hypothetical protein
MTTIEQAFADFIQAEAAAAATDEVGGWVSDINKSLDEANERAQNAARDLATIPATSINDLRLKGRALFYIHDIKRSPGVDVMAKCSEIAKLYACPSESSARELIYGILVDCARFAFDDRPSARCASVEHSTRTMEPRQ